MDHPIYSIKKDGPYYLKDGSSHLKDAVPFKGCRAFLKMVYCLKDTSYFFEDDIPFKIWYTLFRMSCFKKMSYHLKDEPS